MINALAATVGPGHKVDLNDPELTIIAEICQVKRNEGGLFNLLNNQWIRIFVCYQLLRISTS